MYSKYLSVCGGGSVGGGGGGGGVHLVRRPRAASRLLSGGGGRVVGASCGETLERETPTRYTTIHSLS